MAKKRGSRYWAIGDTSHQLNTPVPSVGPKGYRKGSIKSRYRKPRLGTTIGNRLNRDR